MALDILMNMAFAHGAGHQFHLQYEVRGTLGSGLVDFIHSHESLLIMLVQVEGGGIGEGIAQCAIQLNSVLHGYKKRRRDGSQYSPDHHFGIVTTGDTWVFLKLDQSNNRILIDSQAPFTMRGLSEGYESNLQEELQNLFSHFFAIFSVVKGLEA